MFLNVRASVIVFDAPVIDKSYEPVPVVNDFRLKLPLKPVAPVCESAMTTCRVGVPPELATVPSSVIEPEPAFNVRVEFAAAVIPPVTAIP